MTTMNLHSLCPEHVAGLVDELVDYCISTYGSREGAIRALEAVGVGAQQCTNALPHAAHLGDGCPGLALDEYVAAGGTLPLRAQDTPEPGKAIICPWHGPQLGIACPVCTTGPDEPEGPDYDETTETADECRRDLLESDL